MRASNFQQKSTHQPFKPKPLTTEQLTAVDALLLEKSDREAAELAGCSRWAVQGWRTSSPLFMATLAQRREDLFAGAIDRLRSLLGKALDNIAEAIEDGDVTASFALLKAAGVHGFSPPTGETNPQTLLDQLVAQRLADEKLPDRVELMCDPLHNDAKDQRRQAIEVELITEYGDTSERD